MSRTWAGVASRALGTLALLTGFFGAPAAARAAAKSYHFTEVEIDATILPDGSLELVENRTFDFEGSFSSAFFTIDWDPSLIEGFQVTRETSEGVAEPLSVGTELSPGQFRANWSFSATDELVTFQISYRARCAVEVYRDAAHLLWQFVGSGWTEPTDRVRVTVHVPGRATGQLPPRPDEVCSPTPVEEFPSVEREALSAGEVRAWGHGPLGGEVRIPDPSTVTLRIEDLAPSTFVEGSVLFPPESVPLAFQHHSARRAQILAEEGALAREANDLRRRYLSNRRASAVLMILIPLLMAGLVAVAYRRDRVPGVPRHLQEPPEDVHPVELAYLWSAYRGSLSPRNAYRTQLLHLARLRAIDMWAVGRVTAPDHIRIRLRKMPPRRGLDRDFAEFLFSEDGSKELSMKELSASTGRPANELRDWGRRLRVRTRENVRRLTSARARPESWAVATLAVGTLLWAIAGDAVAGSSVIVAAVAALLFGLAAMTVIGFVRRGRPLRFGFGTTLGAVALILFVLPASAIANAFLRDGDRGAVLVTITLVSWLVALRLMPERFDLETRTRVARWKAFRGFLKEFSSLPDAPALAVVIWEQYLVLATAFDVAGQVEKQVKALIPPAEIPSPLPGVPAGLDSLRFVAGINQVDISSAAFIAVSSSSSGSAFSSGVGSFSSAGGGGGGFSGGGGGGGGGTGGGAD
jgi:uncharacterized membrane protein